MRRHQQSYQIQRHFVQEWVGGWQGRAAQELQDGDLPFHPVLGVGVRLQRGLVDDLDGDGQVVLPVAAQLDLPRAQGETNLKSPPFPQKSLSSMFHMRSYCWASRSLLCSFFPP